MILHIQPSCRVQKATAALNLEKSDKVTDNRHELENGRMTC